MSLPDHSASEGVCEHLQPLVEDLRAGGRWVGDPCSPWERNCRLWVYTDCELDLGELRTRLALPDFVEDYSHLGRQDGAEHGLWCARCHDAVVGIHPEVAKRHPVPVFPPRS